jgi:uncharacterized cupredoxin-like copper-binding protein
MSGPRAGYAIALAASVLMLVGSMAAVAGRAGSTTSAVGSSVAGGGPGGGMMNGIGRSGTSSLTCTAPANLPGTTVHVDAADMGMSRMMGGAAVLGTPMRLRTSTRSVAAGQVSFVVANLGARTHELVILPLADGERAGRRMPGADATVTETGSVGEASTSCGSGAGEGIASGSVGWVTVTLPSGRYELVCNEPNHYADGMWQELDVT